MKSPRQIRRAIERLPKPYRAIFTVRA